MQDDLKERLEALHVWPQFVADDHADILSPRQSAGLYEVGNVAHEAASAGRADNARIAALEADNARLMGLVKVLQPYLAVLTEKPQKANWTDRYCAMRDQLEVVASDILAKIKETPDA